MAKCQKCTQSAIWVKSSPIYIPSVDINGQVSYTARDASVLVQGKMYGADGYQTGEYRVDFIQWWFFV